MSEFVAIVGSRGYQRLGDVEKYVQGLPEGTVVVSGGARGVDKAAEDAAMEAGLDVEVYLPDWDKYGRVAGFIRNKDIEENADRCVAFWDGKSKGTKNTVSLFEKAGKPVEVRVAKG